MNLEQLRKEIEADEGCRYDIYLDHLGYPTFGIGHLISETDPEHGAEVGTSVSEARVIQAFNTDMGIVLDDCNTLYEDFETLPEEVQHIIANMMFNMGRPRLSKFKGMKAGVDARDWNKAADEMVDSRWYQQVTNRAQRLVDRMRAVEA
jgi:lysozyme